MQSEDITGKGVEKAPVCVRTIEREKSLSDETDCDEVVPKDRKKQNGNFPMNHQRPRFKECPACFIKHDHQKCP